MIFNCFAYSSSGTPNFLAIATCDGVSLTVLRPVLVVLVAEAYLLPSTVVEKMTIVQRWAHIDGSWILEKSSRELVPEISSLNP